MIKNKKKLLIIATTIVFGVILIISQKINFSQRSEMTQDNQKVLPPQTNSEGQVTIQVAPQELSSSSWEFAIISDAHSGSLDQDLVTSSILVGDDGRQYLPISWDGDPSGGHHRKGVLKFKPIIPNPSSIELKIYQLGTDNEKVFRWEF